MHRHPPAGLSSSKSVRSDLQLFLCFRHRLFDGLGAGSASLALRVAQSLFLVRQLLLGSRPRRVVEPYHEPPRDEFAAVDDGAAAADGAFATRRTGVTFHTFFASLAYADGQRLGAKLARHVRTAHRDELQKAGPCARLLHCAAAHESGGTSKGKARYVFAEQIGPLSEINLSDAPFMRWVIPLPEINLDIAPFLR